MDHLVHRIVRCTGSTPHRVVPHRNILDSFPDATDRDAYTTTPVPVQSRLRSVGVIVNDDHTFRRYLSCRIKKERIPNKRHINVSKNDELRKFSVTAYAYRTDSTRIVDLGRTVRRIRVLGSSSLELCYVAQTFWMFLSTFVGI